MIITPMDKLLSESEDIQKFLEITMGDDPAEATARGNDLATYVARTGKMLADAKLHLNRKKRSEVVDLLVEVAKKTPNATSTTTNELVKSICREEQYLVDWIDRLNRAATHQLDWCRTLISKAKEEMRLAGNQRT